MKFLILTGAYPEYLKDFFRRHPALAGQPYLKQRESFDRDSFAWADFWSHALRPLGHEVMEVTLNAELMQKTWAAENGVNSEEPDWQEKIALEQVSRFRPDILWYLHYDVGLLKELKSRTPSIRHVLGWVGSALPSDISALREIDTVLSCAPETVKRLADAGCRSAHLNHAFEPRINKQLTETRRDLYDVSFVGQIVRKSEFHFYRESILKAMVENGLKPALFSPSSEIGFKNKVTTQLKLVAYHGVKTLEAAGVPRSLFERIPKLNRIAALESAPIPAVDPHLARHLKPPVYGTGMYGVLASSKATLNIHADSSPTHASNMRLYEASGVGTCLVTDWKDNLSELFAPDSEVVTYRSAEECTEKLKWLLDHPTERRAIAMAGQKRCLAQHTFTHRAQELTSILNKRL